MLFTLSEHKYIPYGVTYISFLGTESKILTFESEVAKIIMYHKQSRAEERIERQPFLPHHPPPKILCPSDWAKTPS